MATLQECLEEVEGDEEEDDDELRKLALEYTKGLVGMVDSTACSFMPDTGERGRLGWASGLSNFTVI